MIQLITIQCNWWLSHTLICETSVQFHVNCKVIYYTCVHVQLDSNETVICTWTVLHISSTQQSMGCISCKYKGEYHMWPCQIAYMLTAYTETWRILFLCYDLVRCLGNANISLTRVIWNRKTSSESHNCVQWTILQLPVHNTISYFVIMCLLHWNGWFTYEIHWKCHIVGITRESNTHTPVTNNEINCKLQLHCTVHRWETV